MEDLSAQGQAVLDRASAKVDAPVVYASTYRRNEATVIQLVLNSFRGFFALGTNLLAAAIRAKSTQLSSGIPKSGWVIATRDHLCIYNRGVFGGIGAKKGHIPIELIRSVKLDHQKNDRKIAAIEFRDSSYVELVLTTRSTAEACAAWSRAMTGEKEPGTLGRRSRMEQKFDTELLYSQSSISR